MKYTKKKLLSELRGLRDFFEENNYSRYHQHLGVCMYLYDNTDWYVVLPREGYYVEDNPFTLIRHICETLDLSYNEDMGPKNRKMVIDLLEHDLTIAAEYL